MSDPTAPTPELPEDDDAPQRRVSDGLIIALTRTVQSMADRLEEISGKLEGFTTTGEVNQKVADLESRMNWRSVIGGVAIIALAAIFAWYSNARANDATRKQFAALAEQRHEGQLANCAQNNQQNQVLRALVDRSVQQQASFDPSKLSPAAQEILAEFARAAAASGGQSYRDFTYALTPIVDCNKLYPPLSSADKKPAKSNRTTTTAAPTVTTM